MKKVNNEIIDISDINCALEKTNKKIYDLCQNGPIIQTPIGLAVVAPLSIIKLMKISSLPLNKVKNDFDLSQLVSVELSEKEHQILIQREIETLQKINIQKGFFEQYPIDRKVSHDMLHSFLSPTPAYLSVIGSDGVSIEKELFMELCKEDKIRVLWEEAFVLSLERYLIPRIVKNPVLINHYCDLFFNVNKTSDPGLYWLNKLCANGLIKDHPQWLSNWGRDNYLELTGGGFTTWWNTSFDNLPKDFWIKILKLS